MLELAEKTARLAELVAARTGKSPEAVMHDAVEATARAAGVLPTSCKFNREELISKMRAISEQCAELPVYDSRTPDDILGYDEFGLPS